MIDINYQITTKYVTVPKPKIFHELNTAYPQAVHFYNVFLKSISKNISNHA